MAARRLTVRCDGTDADLLRSCLAAFDVTLVPDEPGAEADLTFVTRVGVVDRIVPDRWATAIDRSTVAVLVHAGRLDAVAAAEWISRTVRSGVDTDGVPGAQVQCVDVEAPKASELPRLVRRSVREAWSDGDRAEMVCLAASEVASNAVQHARRPPAARIIGTGTRLVIEAVDDQPRALPCLADPTVDAPADGLGHGLRIVAAVADRWGVTVSPERKVVWCEFDRPS